MVVTDNHQAHHSYATQGFLQANNLEMVFMPKYSSVLSPAERFWSMVKNSWRKEMAALRIKYDQAKMNSEAERIVALCAERAKHTNIMSSADPYLDRIARGELV